MQHAAELRAQGIDVIDLGPGEPDFPTPQPIKDAGVTAINSNFTRYTPGSGTTELRSRLAETFNDKWGTSFSSANVIITCGAKHVIFNLCMATLNDGDEVLIPCPFWVTFPEVVKMAGAVPVEVETIAEDGFLLRPETVEAKLSKNTRGLIVNTPNNPTGAVLPEKSLRDLVGLARDKNIFLLFDETYEYLTYEGRKHTSLAACIEPGDDNFAVVGSFSKTYSMTGWRVGYCIGPSPLITKLGQLQSHQTGNPTSISQKAALAALEGGTRDLEVMRLEYEKRRRLVLDEITTIPGFSCAPPFGAFYAFPNVSEAIRALEITNSEEFSKFLIQEARVATVPGSAFGIEGFIRVSYATSVENLLEGFGRIRRAVAGD